MLYGLYLRLRHLAYDKGWKKAESASVPTVCIGNVTVGGTGKTPHTELLLKTLLHSDEWAFKPLAVLSRGYRRKSKGFQLVNPEGSADFYGDEPLQMARKFPSVTVAVDKDRVEGCRMLAEAGTQLIVLDDAFQYRKLRPGVSIVLVDYYRPVHKDRLLPWGRLRDFPSRLKEADIVIVTKCPASLEEDEREQWRKDLGLLPSQKLFFTTLCYSDPVPVFPEGDTRYAYAHRLVLFTGIANDAPLRSYLSDTYKLIKCLRFPDHHRYGRSDVRQLSAAIRENPTACLMTTEKDAQRIVDVKNVPDTLRERMFFIPVQADFLSAEEQAAFREALLAAL